MPGITAGLRGLPSVEDLCAAAVRTELVALKLPGYEDGRPLPGEEIQEREYWHTDRTPHRGLTVSTVPERYAGGPLGLQEVAYGVAITGAVQRTHTANNPKRLLRLWLSAARRRFLWARIPIGDELNGGVRRSICHVTAGNTKMPRGRTFADWTVRQIIVWFWMRELPDPGE